VLVTDRAGWTSVMARRHQWIPRFRKPAGGRVWKNLVKSDRYGDVAIPRWIPGWILEATGIQRLTL